MLISENDAKAALAVAVAKAGGMRAYARKLRVSTTSISYMMREIGSQYHRHITGDVARDLGLKPVYAYELTEPKKDPKQELYENERRKWALLNDIPLQQSPTMRVAVEPREGRRFPEKVRVPADKEPSYKR